MSERLDSGDVRSWDQTDVGILDQVMLKSWT
jgi:hypothetical protein